MNAINKVILFALLYLLGGLNIANASRYQYSLQRFGTEDLAVFATAVTSNGCRYGIIIDPDGFLHTVVVGDYLGNHNGKVVSITKYDIEIEEIYAAGDDRWIAKNVLLKRRKESGSK